LTDAPEIDWEALRGVALAAAERAYVPYSRYRVGAAGLVDDGRVIAGCNVENVSYGLTLCAECILVGELRLTGGGKLVAVLTVGNGHPGMPCGRCRQLLLEHGSADTLVDGDGTPRRLGDLLPHAFTEFEPEPDG
jgi:cytidine deaminase